MRIAITGGIGSGKSYVCKKLEERGIDIYDCDSGAKHLMHTSTELKRRLTELIGSNTYVDGCLNKAVVARFLMASEANKQAVNDIVHPMVIEDFYNSGLTWMECAILFEAHLQHTVDKVICVSAPIETRLQRIMQRDGISREKAEEWIELQMKQDEIERLSDFVITNDGVASIEKQIDKILTEDNHLRNI